MWCYLLKLSLTIHVWGHRAANVNRCKLKCDVNKKMVVIK